MNKRISFIKLIWRFILRKYYGFEKQVLEDPSKLNKYKQIVGKLPIDKRKIVFDNFSGKGYGENPKYIANELLREGKKTKLIWICNDIHGAFPQGIRPVYTYSLRAFYESATAKVWVCNTRGSRLTKKRKDQIYLQTWHGSIGFKKIEKDAELVLPNSYVLGAKEDGQIVDGIIADGKWQELLYKRAFWLNENCEILKVGSPRLDVFFNKTDSIMLQNRIRKQIGIRNDTFVVLYAPTFRDGKSTAGYLSGFETLQEFFLKKYQSVVFLIRFHPNCVDLANDLYGFNTDSIRNVSHYPDVQELMLISDCLITDYSSTAYDFALLRKPVFLYISDFEDYVKDRGVYNDFYHQPFTISKTENELIDNMKNFDSMSYMQKLSDFFEKYPSFNSGNASAQSAKWILKKI